MVNVNSKLCLIVCTIVIFHIKIYAQLKYVVEDFEGFADGAADLKPNGVFAFGNIQATVDYNENKSGKSEYKGQRFLRVSKSGKQEFGGWGKGISSYVELDANKDYLNFYFFQPVSNDTTSIKIELQEDDNENGSYEMASDDSWVYEQKLNEKNSWNLISIPLNKFKRANKGGDGIFNINYKQGKLLCLVISFISMGKQRNDQVWSFDFICFSRGKLITGTNSLDAPSALNEDFCNLGIWSKEGNTADFSEIPLNFENAFKYGTDKKLGVVHFFQPFAFDGGNTQNSYPSIEKINEIIQRGYIPMITLEDHFVNAKPNVKQPNLYSIVEGHFDPFFNKWAKQIKEVNGTVLLRILHEFNGDWYPWCIANNDKNPELLIKAYRHIYDIFKIQQVSNVKFIWCPNSTSFPQEKWNFIMDAYPGDEYVDYVGLDIYNGAGKGIPLWRSFRKEGIENYFVLTQSLPKKALFVCEVASRERQQYEPPSSQDKVEWIRQMSQALTSDMSKIRLLTWFSEKGSFKINSSNNAQGAFLNYILKDNYFKSGTKHMYSMFDN